MRFHTSGLAAVGLAALTACGAEPEGRPARYAAIGAPLRGWRVPVASPPTDAAAWIDGVGVFTATSTGVALEGASTEGAAVRRVFPDASGRFTAALRLDRGVLVGTTRGLFAQNGDWLDPSPIGQALGAVAVTDLARTAGAVWIATEAGLFRWSGDRAAELRVDGTPLPAARLATDGADVLAASEGAVFIFSASADAVRRLEGPDAATDVALLPNGERWALDASGLAWWAPRGEPLAPIRAPVEARTLAESAGAVWLEDAEGAMLRASEGALHPVDGMRGRLLGAAGPGSALVADEAGLARFFHTLSADLEGLPAGPIDRPLEVRVRPLFASDVAAVEAELAGAPLEIQPAPWRFTLDPAGAAPGARELVVRVRYADDKPEVEVRRAVLLAGGDPTWSVAIEPLFLARCALCHGEGASARILATREAWTSAFDLILENVRAGRMPLPPGAPLDAAEIGLLESWRDGGFPE